MPIACNQRLLKVAFDPLRRTRNLRATADWNADSVLTLPCKGRCRYAARFPDLCRARRLCRSACRRLGSALIADVLNLSGEAVFSLERNRYGVSAWEDSRAKPSRQATLQASIAVSDLNL